MARFDQITELEQAHPKAVAAGFRTIDITADRQVVQDAMRRRRMQARLLADLLQRHRIGIRGQQIQQAEGALQHLDRRRLAFGFRHPGIVSQLFEQTQPRSA